MDDVKSQTLVAEADKFVSAANALVITTNADYDMVASNIRNVKAKFKEIDEHRVYLKAPALESVRRIDGFFQPVLKKLEQVEAIFKRKSLDYQAKLEAERKEKQRQADELARQERERLDAIARQERQKAEAAAAEIRRKAEAEAAEIRRQAEAAAAAGREAEAQRLALAAAKVITKAETKADKKTEAAYDVAHTLEQQAAVISAPTIADEAPKAAGQSFRTVHKFRILDERKLPRAYLMPNEKMLTEFAEATKGKVPVEGVEFYEERVMASRSR